MLSIIQSYGSRSWMAESVESQVGVLVSKIINGEVVLDPHAHCDLSQGKPSITKYMVTAGYAGQAIGSYIFGYISDNFGRKIGILLVATSVSIFGFLSVAAQKYWGLIIVRFFVGLGLGGLHVAVTLLYEMVPSGGRHLYICVEQVFFSIGGILISAIGFGMIPKLGPEGWRYFLIVAAAPTTIAIFFYPLLLESPRWLISEGRYEHARKNIYKIFKFNKLPVNEELIREAIPQLQLTSEASPKDQDSPDSHHKKIAQRLSSHGLNKKSSSQGKRELSNDMSSKEAQDQEKLQNQSIEEKSGEIIQVVGNEPYTLAPRRSEGVNSISQKDKVDKEPSPRDQLLAGQKDPRCKSFLKSKLKLTKQKKNKQGSFLEYLKDFKNLTTFLIIVYLWFAIGMAYYGSIQVPVTITQNGREPFECDYPNRVVIASNWDYINQIAQTAGEIPGQVFVAVLMFFFPRKYSFSIVSFLIGFSLIVQAVVVRPEYLYAPWEGRVLISFQYITRSCCLGGVCIMYIISNEVVVTGFRSFIMGLGQLGYEIGATIAPLIVIGMTQKKEPSGAFGLQAAFILTAAILVLFLPFEQSGKDLLEVNSNLVQKDKQNAGQQNEQQAQVGLAQE